MANVTLHFEERYNTLVAGTNDGFYLFNLCNNFKKSCLYCEIYKPYLIRMFSLNHCLFVTEKNTSEILNTNDNVNSFAKSYTVMLFNIEQNKIMLHFTIGQKILNIIIVDKYILIVTANQILVYSQTILTNSNDPNNVAFVKTIHTFTNPCGLCSAKCYENTLFIATLGRIMGEIIICTLKKKSNLYIQAHNNNIANIVLDDKCELVSTTSESGTLINVFDIPSCTKIYQFRRGIFGAVIHDITFDGTRRYLACCSNNGTCHVFYLYDKCDEKVDNKNTTSNFNMLGSIVPVCNSEWAYKLFKINSGVKSHCYFEEINNKTCIHVVGNDMMYYFIDDIENNNNNQDQVIKHDVGKLVSDNANINAQ